MIMRKVYTVLFSLLIAGGASAQWHQNIGPVVKEKTTNYRATGSAIQYGGERVVFHTDDFSDCEAWTPQTAYDAGFDQFFEDLTFECGTGLEPDGGAPIAAINSTSADNGFLMVDSDGAANEVDIENCWIQTDDPIDCSEHPFVTLSFETYYRMWDGGANDGNEFCFVEISTDGVTWPDVTTTDDEPGRFEVFPDFTTGVESSNPELIEIDITSAAGGEEQVWIRFRWRGTFGYAWMIDDMKLADTATNDLKSNGYASYTDQATWAQDTGLGFWEYGAIPQSQIQEFVFSANVANNGSAPQPNTIMDVAVNGSSVGTTDLGFTLPYLGRDTLRLQGYTPPSDLGVYDVTYTFSSDSLDEDDSNNVAEQSFEITEYQYGRDNGVFTGVFPFDGSVEYQAATPYVFVEEATIYAIDVAFMNTSEPNTDVLVHVLDLANLDIFASSDETPILNPDVNGNSTDDSGNVTWYTIELEDPFEVAAGEAWVASVEHQGGPNVQIGESKYTPDQTAFVYGPFGANQTINWYFTNEVPMVRFNLNPNPVVNVEEVEGANFTLMQNRPNPTDVMTTISYELNQTDNVSLEVRDITGKLVYTEAFGQQPTGTNNIDLNVDGYEAGIYTYTLVVGGERLTNRMIVK